MSTGARVDGVPVSSSGQPSLQASENGSPSLEYSNDVRRCEWCSRGLEVTAAHNARFCGVKCRKAAWRLRHQVQAEERNEHPKRLCFADPPYPGLARKYYLNEPTYGGEVDHAVLKEANP
jgi:hypothetical protein